jgi:predicted branched-subunit amino acid permease
LGDLLGVNAVKGIITFALGGLVLAITFFFTGIVMITGRSDSLFSVLFGFLAAFIGFLLIGLGLWALIQDAMITGHNEK